MVARIAASAVLLVAAVLIPYEGPWRFVLFLPAYFVIGWDVLWKAARNIAHGQVFDENFLMALATVGAFCTGFFRFPPSPMAEMQQTLVPANHYNVHHIP